MLLLALSLLLTDDPPAEPAFPQDGTFTITVVDKTGSPIEGAEIDPWALRLGGGHGEWPEAAVGPKPVVKTDASGVATFTVPTRVGERTLETVSAIVLHPDHVPLYEHIDAVNALQNDKVYETRLTMKDGTKLEIDVLALDGDVDLDNVKITCPGVGSGNLPFKSDGNHIVTHPVADDAQILRLVATNADDSQQFSDWLSWSPDDDDSRHITAILQKGLILEGRLSDNVPRPVKRGWIVCDCTGPGMTFEHRILGQAEAAVDEDGTFVLRNVPHGSDLQITAICEGFTSEPPDVETHQRMLQKYDESGYTRDGGGIHMPWVSAIPEDESPLVVPMRPAASLKVTVLKTDGTPAENVSIYTSPNDHCYGLGNWIFANSGMPAEEFRKKPLERSQLGFEFRGTTDANGVAIIESIPPLRASIEIATGDWRDGTARSLDFKGEEAASLQSGKTAELTITLTEPL